MAETTFPRKAAAKGLEGVDLTGLWKFEHMPRNPDDRPLSTTRIQALRKQLVENHGRKVLKQRMLAPIIIFEMPAGFTLSNDTFTDPDLRDFVVWKEGMMLEDVGCGREGITKSKEAGSKALQASMNEMFESQEWKERVTNGFFKRRGWRG